MELFQSTLKAKIMEDFFHFYHPLLCYAWPSLPPVTLKMRTACSLLFMEIHWIRRKYPFSLPAVPFYFFWERLCYACLGGNLLTAALPLDLQEDDHLHWLY